MLNFIIGCISGWCLGRGVGVAIKQGDVINGILCTLALIGVAYLVRNRD